MIPNASNFHKFNLIVSVSRKSVGNFPVKVRILTHKLSFDAFSVNYHSIFFFLYYTNKVKSNDSVCRVLSLYCLIRVTTESV